MVKRCNHTIESIIKKSMQSQSDWGKALPSVLFAIRTAQHASSGVTPFCMLYGYDPILPFQYADKMKHGILSGDDADCESDVDIHSEVSGDTSGDPVTTRIKEMEKNHKTIFAKASKSIKKAQKHQAKCYNNRQNKGKPFEISNLWLKCNKHEDSCKAKLKQPYTGPYSIVAKCGASAFYLKDCYGHKLLHSVPTSHLVRFYDKGVYKSDGVSSVIQPTSGDAESEEPGNLFDTCQRVHSQDSQNKTSTPKKNHGMIPSQLAIISSKELPVSSDESSTMDVGYKPMPSPINPWGDMNVDEIPLEIVDHFSDSEQEVIITDVIKKASVTFRPLSCDDRKIVAMKFSLVISEKSHQVEFKNIGKMCTSPPVITQSTCGNGACLFNSYSMLLTGRDTFSTIIHHVVCNYISTQ